VSCRAPIGHVGREIFRCPFKLRRDARRRSKETDLRGVRLVIKRGTTQTEVKVPKFLLSVKLKGVFKPRQQGGKLRSSYPLKSA
jgi:hypothetical protein